MRGSYPDLEGVPPVPPPQGREDGNGDEESPPPPIPPSTSNRGKRAVLTAAAALLLTAMIAVAIAVPLALRGRSPPTTPAVPSAAKAAGPTAPSCAWGGDCPENADCLVTAKDGGGGEDPRCFCRDGFVLSSGGGGGAICEDVNECLGEGDGHDCSENAVCVNLQGRFDCSCDLGFVGDGWWCDDADECEGDNNPCPEGSECVNLPGNFQCLEEGEASQVSSTPSRAPSVTNRPSSMPSESPSISADPSNRPSVRPSASAWPTSRPSSQPSAQPTGCPGAGGGECSENAECVDLTEERRGCRCNEGFVGDGVTTCEDLDECLGEGGGNDCSENAVCANSAGSFDCSCRAGHYGDPRGGACEPMGLEISSPSHGSFSEESTIEVRGKVVAEPLEDVDVAVNGIQVAIEGDGSFTIAVSLDEDDIFNGVRAELTHSPTGFKLRDRVVVIAAQSAPLGGTVSRSAAVRIAKGSFETLERIVNDDLGRSDLSDLIPRGTKLIDGRCFINSFFGCLTRGDVKVMNTRNNGIDFKVGPQEITVTLKGMKVDLEVDTNTIDCDIEITANSGSATASYSLDPDPSDRTNMRVSQLKNIRIDFSRFNEDFDCDFSLGSIIQSVVGDVEGDVRDGLKNFLQSDAVRGEIEDALAQLEITEPIFAGMGASSSTPIFDVTQDTEGITLAMDTVLTTLDPNPSSPVLTETVSVPQQFPFAQLSSSFPLTPRGRPYDIAFVLSDSVLNQIMAVQVEGGEFDLEVAEIPIGTGDPTPITAVLLSLLVSPKFAGLASVQGLRLRMSPTLAPVLAGKAGPNGELAMVLLSHLLLDVVSEDGLHARMTVDATMLLDFEADEATGRAMPLLKSPKDASPRMTLLDNPLNIDEAEISEILMPLFPELVSLLGGSIPSFALPNFFGLTLSVAEISRVGDFVGIFVNRSG